MSATNRAFRAAYTQAFEAFVARRGEPQLRAAYELGREAVTSGLSVLDVAVAHHDALARGLADAADAPELAAAAGDFFLEALSAYEMVQRGLRDARETAALERRQAALLRQLSNFLADASLAIASDSLEEMLQLVAEQARELMRADACRVTLTLGARRVEVVSADPDTWSGVPQAQIVAEAETQRAAGERRTLSEPLNTLDGHEFGAIEVSAARFTELDAAVLAQLAQMASAAVERRRLYQRQ